MYTIYNTFEKPSSAQNYAPDKILSKTAISKKTEGLGASVNFEQPAKKVAAYIFFKDFF